MQPPNEVPNSPTHPNAPAFEIPYQSCPSRWNAYLEMALKFDGYAAYPNNLKEVANNEHKKWMESHSLSQDLRLLRSCLFFEARRSHFVEGYPQEADMGYLDALFEKINSAFERD